MRNPGLYPLNDHIFCFAADWVTMKRPQFSLFCMQASTGYVEDEPAPPSGRHLTRSTPIVGKANSMVNSPETVREGKERK